MTERAHAQVEFSLRLPVDEFTLDVKATLEGRVTGIFGRSGSGKSILLEALAGLRPAAEGRVRVGERVFLDTPRVNLPPEARNVGYVAQSPLLFPHLSVRENLAFGARRAKSRGRLTGPASEDALKYLELDALLERRPSTLSGGEQARVALGRALCSGPELLLLDEPFASLELPLRRRLVGMLVSFTKSLEIPVILVSHDPIDLQAACHSVLVMERGKLIAQGSPWAVLMRPAVSALQTEPGFQNLLSVRVAEHSDDTTLVHMGEHGTRLVIPRCEAEIGEAILVSVAARDIVVATERPRGISARNVLSACVAEVEAAADYRLVHLTVAGETRVLAELTQGACSELGLAPGANVHLVMKTHALRYVSRAG
ncbi:MAG TPA: molybdenum ABC transporter ATP-binding protein [Polyangiaceae bacterium]